MGNFFLSFFFLEKNLNVVWYCVYKLCKFFENFLGCVVGRFLDWPEDALSEVSIKLMEDEENVGDADAKANVCKVFVIIHKSVVDMSQKMYLQVKRKNYVTPTSYLEFAKG
jgi:dynein heavy chain